MNSNNQRSVWFKCARCPRKPYYPMKQILVNRNSGSELITIKQPTVPNWIRQSEIIKNSAATKGVKQEYGNQTLSPFGYWAGSPFGSGSPPRNTFV
jgi:hypothetical protein